MNNETSRTDRRVARTRRQLRDALMSLILERSYSAITVEDITERADLGRTTFYLHYHDKDELLFESLERIAEELKAQVENLADLQIESGKMHVNPVGLVFRHVDENRDLYRVILKVEGSNQALNRIRDFIEQSATEFFNRHMRAYVSQESELPREIVAGYFASSMLGFITLWLDKDLPLQGDEAADLFMILFFRGASRVLNLTIEP